MSSDPTRPLEERTTDELVEFLDSHILWALEAAGRLVFDAQLAEDLVRDRLVAIADEHTTMVSIRAENKRRQHARLSAFLAIEGTQP